jgi:cullin-4
MRKGQGSMSAEAFEKVLNDIVDLVKFTKDKDVFKEFYITQLAKRLLLGRSASTEEEINMVKKLQIGACQVSVFLQRFALELICLRFTEYGEEFTTGDAMMKDLTQSEE